MNKYALIPTGEEVELPRTVPALDMWVESICNDFELENNDDTYEMIATTIMHMPMTRAVANKGHFGACVIKSLANQAAYKKLEEFRNKRAEADKAKE